MNPIPGVYVIPDFLSDIECSTYMNMDFPKESYEFTSSGKFKNSKLIDPVLSTFFYDRLTMFMKEDRGKPFLRANNLIMMGEYNPGNSFGMHTDTGLYYDLNTKTKSAWTLLIYLNDEFTGGTTSFYTDHFELTTTIIPKKGTALLFDIDLWHKGDELTSGIKKWIGCEIIGNM